MTTQRASRPRRHRWEIWAALVLGLLFLGLGAPLMVRGDDSGPLRAERHIEARPNG